MNRYFSLPLTLCACLFIGCGSIDDNQPARLISTVPAENEPIEHDGLIRLYFDKVVTDVRVNGFAARHKYRQSAGTAWEIAVVRLQLWPNWAGGLQPEKSVQLNITFEDVTGRHHEKVNVLRPEIVINGEFPKIIEGTVWNGAKDVDSELVNTTGIQIKFNRPIKGDTILLKLKDGSLLNWIAEWSDSSVTLSPRDGDRLQNGTEYILEIIGEDATGTKFDFEIRFTTKE